MKEYWMTPDFAKLTYRFYAANAVDAELAKKDTKIETLEDIIRIAALNIDERDYEIAELSDSLEITLNALDDLGVPHEEYRQLLHKKSPTG